MLIRTLLEWGDSSSSSTSLSSLSSTEYFDEIVPLKLNTHSEFANPEEKCLLNRSDEEFVKMRKKKTVNPEDDIPPATYAELMRYANRMDWILLISGICLSIVGGALQPCGSIVFQGITNTLMKGQAQHSEGKLDLDQFTNDMLFYVQMYFYQGVLVFIVGYLSTACFFTLCERQVHRIRKHFLKQVLNQDAAWFDKNEVGKLTQRMSSDIDRIRDGTSDKVSVVIQAFSCLISGAIIGFAMSWQMSLVMIIVVPFVAFSIWGSARSVKTLMKKEMHAYGAAGAVAEEVINGIRTVAAFNAQEFESKRYGSLLKKGCKNGIRKAFFMALFSGLYLFVLFGSMGIAFWFGTNLVMDGYVSPGTVFAVFWSFVIGALRLGQAMPQIGAIVSARVAAGEIFSIIDRKPDLDYTGKGGRSLDDVKGNIEFTNIHFRYPARPDVKILNGVSFGVEAGKTVALVGHSGCGKSTMIGLLMRFYEQEQGSVTLDGIPLQDLNVEWLRKTVGIVSQEPIVFATTVEENMRMGKEDVTEEEMIAACQMANAHEFILKLPDGYHTKIGEGGVKLSGGQKQRLAIARALVRNPRILLLDEATSALDTESERIVQAAIENASSSRTTIVIAHRLSTIRNADRIIVFDHGQIVESGTHEELMELDAVYKQLVLAQEINREGMDEEDVIMEDVDESTDKIIKNFAAAASDEEPEDRLARASRRLRNSMASTQSLSMSTSRLGADIEDKKEEMESENAEQASILDIWRFSRREQRVILIGLLCTILRGLATPTFTVVYGRLFNSLTEAFTSHKVDMTSANMVNAVSFGTLGLFAGVTTFLSGLLFGYSGERMTMRLRMEVFRNLLRQDGTFYDDVRHSTGKLTARLATDAPNVQAAIDQRLAEVLQGIVSLICGVGIAFYFGWNMAPIGVSIAVVIVIVQLIMTAYLKKRAQFDVQIAEEASRIASESIEYVKTVQALTRQDYVFKQFCAAAERPYRRAITRGFLQAFNYGLLGAFVSLNFGFAYLFGLLLIRGGHTTPFVVFQVIEALNLSSITIMMAASYFPEYLRARISAGLMFKMMNNEPLIDSLSDRGRTPSITGKVELSHVFFAYPSTRKNLTLNDFSVSVQSGQSLALVGPSGCGKSTTIQLLERYYDILAGHLEIDGVDSREINIRHLRNNMSLVGQEPTLFNLTIGQNIGYGLENVTDADIVEAAKVANVHAFVDSLPQKYETRVGGRGAQLSGGQKQRIAIARAVIRNPKILLLDEATSALDTESEKIVQEALDKASQGRTCITIAHRLSTIQNSDVIAVVRDGRVTEVGKHQQLVARRGLYYRLVQKQIS